MYLPITGEFLASFYIFPKIGFLGTILRMERYIGA